MSQLTIGVAASGAVAYDLTALGSADWCAYNGSANTRSRKNITTALITVGVLSGSPGSSGYSNTTGPQFSWSDGTPTASASANGGGAYIISNASSNGWSFTVPADTTSKRLRVYAGIYSGSGIKITATLSDGTPAVTDSSFAYVSGPDPRTAEYTIDFAAASAGQSLVVNVQPVGTGTLSIQGAALSAAAATVPGAPTIGTVTPGNGSASVNGTAPASNGGAAITGYRATSTPGGFTGTSTTLPVNVAGLTNGTGYTFTLAAQNIQGYGPESASSVSVTPTNVNNPPTAPGTIANISGTAGTAITPVDVHGTFSDTDALTYSASPAGTAWPSGLTINSTTGVISGTVAAAGTTNSIKVRATDTASQSVDSNAFNVVISSGPVQVPYNDAAIVFSPYTWDDRGTYKSANAPGAYAKLAFTGTSVTAKFDVSALSSASIAAGSYPIVRMVIDGKFVTDVKLTSANGNAAVSGLSAGPHTVEMYFRAVDVGLADRWTTPVSALRFTGFTIDAAATYSAPAKRAKNMIFFGDSITEGYFVMGQANPDSNNATQTVAPFLAQAVGCELGQIGYSAAGYEQAGNGGVPVLNSVIPNYSAGRSRLVGGVLSPAPDYVCVMHGANGNTTSAGVQTVIDTLRTIAPSARIFLMVPAGGYARAAITAAVAAKSADAKLHLIDLGTEYQPGMSSDVSVAGGGQYSNDNGLHPNLLGNAKAVSGYLPKIQAAIDGTVQPTLTARTATVTLATGVDTSGNPIPAANLTGVKVSFFDEATPDLHSVPRYKTATGTTNASGVLTFPVQSTLASGGTGSVVVQMADGRNLVASVAVA